MTTNKLILLLLATLTLNSCAVTPPSVATIPTPSPITDAPTPFSQAFLANELQTNTAIASIDLAAVLDGGPSKDGIPALHPPHDWASVTQAGDWLDDQQLGVLVTFDDEQRFYPYEVLYWHEIVNDSIGAHDFSVTFCPLCGSVVVFDRQIDGQTLSFGVSGKLWESNLLMYDDASESLWSQIIGEAVIGERTGQQLTLLPKQILSFEQLKAGFPQAQILTRETGFVRNYGASPYGNYESDDTLYFPISGDEDSAFHRKELFHIVNLPSGDSVGFHRSALLSARQAQVTAGKQIVAATVNDDGMIIFTIDEQPTADYVAMWFSWRTHARGAAARIWAGN